MKSLTLLFSVLAIALVPIMQAQAQKSSADGRKGGGRDGGADAQIERIDSAVTLKADQKAKIRSILASTQEKVQALPQEERRTQGAELRRAANREIRAVLTPEQQKKFDAMPTAQRGGEKSKKKNQ